jgi:hypothetical protein
MNLRVERRPRMAFAATKSGEGSRARLIGRQ